MKIAVISDIHENFHNLILFFKEIKKHNVKQIIFLGDFMNNGIAQVLASSPIPVISIWGNNDGDKVAITKTALAKGSNLTVGFDTFDFLEVDGRKLFLTHYPLLAKPMAKSGEYDAVFYGHDHKKNIDKIGNCLIVNPGEISAHKTGIASFAIYDTKTNTAEIVDITETVTTRTTEAVNFLENSKFRFTKSKTHNY
ncbi:metallophosphoesterase [Candidatus Woesearchaeota archaeon]|nr:metallophosphoesterase [Candidatus Woesearchaeota archaeon]